LKLNNKEEQWKEKISTAFFYNTLKNGQSLIIPNDKIIHLLISHSTKK